MPVTFPTALRVEPPPPHAIFETLKLSSPTTDQFYSMKSLRPMLADSPNNATPPVDFALLEANSQRAWNERPATFSTVVTPDSLNFLGRVFGGNVVEWHMRAALAAASEVQKGHSTYSHRIVRGSVTFSEPLFCGDHVHLFAEPVTHVSGDLIRAQPFIRTYRVSLVARRARGFSKVPLSILEIGSSHIDVLHTPLRHDHLSRYRSLRGFNIAPIAINRYEECHPNHFSRSPAREGFIRRASQLTAAADIRFYVEARDILGGDRARDPIVTRDLSFEIENSAYQQTAATSPLTFQLTHHGESKLFLSNRSLKLEGKIRAGATDISTVAATMVQIGRF